MNLNYFTEKFQGKYALSKALRSIFKSNKLMLKEFEIHFWDLPDSIRFILKNELRYALFDKAAKKDLVFLSKNLGISYSYLCHLRRGSFSIDKKNLLKIANLSKTSLNEIEKNLIFIRSRSGQKTKIKFPIKTSNEMASLVGHVYGDGCIPSKKRQFEYSNNRKELITEVKNFTKLIFNLNPISERNSERNHDVKYSSIAGDILKLFGGISSPKILNYRKVPEWILNEKKSYKKYFLRAIFDDDGSVMYSKNFNSKGVNLYWTVLEKNKNNLFKLLFDVKKLLEEFNVFCRDPLISREYEVKGKKRLVIYLNITDYWSLVNYFHKIGFTNREKKLKLEKIIERGARHSKKEMLNLNRSILNLLISKNLATSKIAEMLNLPIQKVLKRLTALEKKEVIEKIGRVSANRSYIWKINEVMNL